jgi:hypothetical protein
MCSEIQKKVIQTHDFGMREGGYVVTKTLEHGIYFDCLQPCHRLLIAASL